MTDSKVCGACRVEKSLDFFNKNRTTKDGHHTRCKECRSKEVSSPERIERMRIVALAKKVADKKEKKKIVIPHRPIKQSHLIDRSMFLYPEDAAQAYKEMMKFLTKVRARSS